MLHCSVAQLLNLRTGVLKEVPFTKTCCACPVDRDGKSLNERIVEVWCEECSFYFCSQDDKRSHNRVNGADRHVRELVHVMAPTITSSEEVAFVIWMSMARRSVCQIIATAKEPMLIGHGFLIAHRGYSLVFCGGTLLSPNLRARFLVDGERSHLEMEFAPQVYHIEAVTDSCTFSIMALKVPLEASRFLECASHALVPCQEWQGSQDVSALHPLYDKSTSMAWREGTYTLSPPIPLALGLGLPLVDYRRKQVVAIAYRSSVAFPMSQFWRKWRASELVQQVTAALPPPPPPPRMASAGG